MFISRKRKPWIINPRMKREMVSAQAEVKANQTVFSFSREKEKPRVINPRRFIFDANRARNVSMRLQALVEMFYLSFLHIHEVKYMFFLYE